MLDFFNMFYKNILSSSLILLNTVMHKEKLNPLLVNTHINMFTDGGLEVKYCETF